MAPFNILNVHTNLYFDRNKELCKNRFYLNYSLNWENLSIFNENCKIYFLFLSILLYVMHRHILYRYIYMSAAVCTAADMCQDT